MSFQIQKITLKTDNLESNALYFCPQTCNDNYAAVFTNGYTSHKGSILPWAQKMMEINIPTILFDLPGHFLGSFHEVTTFEDFKNETPELFNQAHQFLGENKSSLLEDTALGPIFLNI